MAVDRSAFEVVDLFEKKMAEYCGAPFCVTTDSCTNALFLCFKREATPRVPHGRQVRRARLPNKTYVGVVQAARCAGLEVDFWDDDWVGEYWIPCTRVVDSARWLRRGMYSPRYTTESLLICLSFQATKHLPIGRGGAILCDNENDAEWFRRARFDGRDQNVSLFDQEEFGFGAHCYMPPDAAARGLWLMNGLKDHNEPLPAEYPDLSKKRWI